MAVPPSQRSSDSAGHRFRWQLDVLLGLILVTSLPLAIVSIPNTLSVVAGLLPGDLDQAGLMRTQGLALPALMLTVPLAAVALRRVPAAYVLVAGLALVAVSDAAGGYAGSEFVVGVVRVLRGVGAGLVLPATLAAVWARTPVLRALWVGVFCLSLLVAQAFALWPLDDVDSWRVTLQPYPLVTGVALALAAVHLGVWTLSGRPAAPVPDVVERGRVLLSAGPAVGIAVVAVSTASEGWRAGWVIVLAAVAVTALLVMASIGAAESRTVAYTAVAVGLVLLPSAAQITMVEMGGLGGPGLRGLWLPYGVAGVLAVAVSVWVRLHAPAAGRWLAPLGLLAMVAGLCSVRLVVPSADGLPLVLPFGLLVVGAAVALTATLQEVTFGAAAFGLSLGVAGLLAGFLLGTGVQMAMLDGARSVQELVDGFVGALHWWALIGGFLVVLIIALVAVWARRGEQPPENTPERLPCAGGPVGDVLLVPSAEEGDGRRGEAPAASDDGRKGEAPAAGGDDKRLPTVPPQGQSPEDASSP
ncbi:hypothetical protein [Nonomuraea maritima]|uniref:hypothetical protein n=1 Tax=Nonomuraea maritima TaxID=683260 RepID=UPI00115FD288|nr:hypothetical protein [Nonomuraea maritima]